MKEKYNNIITQVCDVVREHAKKEPEGGMEVLEILDSCLEYIHEKALKEIFNTVDGTLIK
jgi:hypothetical protein